jgi:hypothetical protein
MGFFISWCFGVETSNNASNARARGFSARNIEERALKLNDFFEFIAKVLEWLPKPIAGAIFAFAILCFLVYEVYSLHLQDNQEDLHQEIVAVQLQLDEIQLKNDKLIKNGC